MRNNESVHPSQQQDESLLDRALQSYSAEPPREGLEQRILARLASEPQTRKASSVWRLGLAGFAVAAALLAVLFLLPTQRRITPGVAKPTAQKVSHSKAPSAAPLRFTPSTPRPVKLSRTRRPRRFVSKPFPLPQPSPQERLLISATQAQRKALLATLRQSPVSVAPIQVSQLHIQPITIQPLAQQENQ